MSKSFKVAVTLLILLATSGRLTAQGLGEKIGERLDRGISEIGDELRRGWAKVQESVDRLGVQGRVYSRLRWDKAIDIASIQIEVKEDKVVTLSGTVPSQAARIRAVTLAQDTVGVQEVVDRLVVASPKR